MEEGGGGPQLLSGFRFLLPLAPAGYRRRGQVLPFKADFPRLGCAESCLGPSLSHSLLIKMCAQRDVGPLGEEGEPSPSHHPFVFFDCSPRQRDEPKEGVWVHLWSDAPGLDGQDKTFLVPEVTEGSGPTAPALSEGPELSSARVELGHPLPCQAAASTEPRPCWGWSCPTLWASSFLSPQLVAFYFLLLIPICPKLLQNTSKGSQRMRCAL